MYEIHDFKSSLCQVTRMSDSGQIEWVCTYCGKSFGFKQNWKRHVVVHTKERNYICQFCGQSFKFPSNKTRHEATCRMNHQF